MDREETVRQMAIDSIKSAGLAKGELLSSDVIEAVGARCADKKVRRRATACCVQMMRAVCCLAHSHLSLSLLVLSSALCSSERSALHG